MKMKNSDWQTKKFNSFFVGIVFTVTGYYLFYKHEYGWGCILILSLLFLLKIDEITELAFDISGKVKAKFNIPAEKIEKNIKENNEPITNRNFLSFRNIERKILSELQKRYDGEMKTLIHFVYGKPDKPEFSYTPDGSLQTKNLLYFFEIKYILKPELAKNIVDDTLGYLKKVHEKLSPSIGDKKFIIKLILASKYDLSKTSFETPPGIEVEFHRV